MKVIICALGFSKSEIVRSAVCAVETQLRSENIDFEIADTSARPGAMLIYAEQNGDMIVLITQRIVEGGCVEIKLAKGKTFDLSVLDSVGRDIKYNIENKWFHGYDPVIAIAADKTLDDPKIELDMDKDGSIVRMVAILANGVVLTCTGNFRFTMG